MIMIMLSFACSWVPASASELLEFSNGIRQAVCSAFVQLEHDWMMLHHMAGVRVCVGRVRESVEVCSALCSLAVAAPCSRTPCSP